MRRIADYFDVPVESLTAETPQLVSLETDETQLLTYFREFNREGKGRMLDFADSMRRSGKYAVGANYFAQ